MSKSYNKNNHHMSGSQNINSGNQFNIINSGDNSPITIELHNSGSNAQTLLAYETECVDLTKLKSEKLREMILPTILTIADILLWMVDKHFISGSPWNILFSISIGIILVIILVFVTCTIKDYLGLFRLKKVGQASYYIPKYQAILLLLKTFCTSMSNDVTYESSRIGVSRVFKNEKNTIFEIKGCTCPYCQSIPIGYMRPRKRISNSIEFICDQNSDHVIKFDWKKTILK